MIKTHISRRGVWFMNYIHRALEDVFILLNKQFSAIFVTGPRQAGKTTMLIKLMEEENRGRTYVTLDDLNERQLAKQDPALFFQIHKPPLFIDEVQYAPELFSQIKIWADQHQNPGDFWLTGSQIFRLMRGVQESLAGRICLLNLFPLSQQEIFSKAAMPFEVSLEAFLTRKEDRTPADITEIYTRIFNGGMPALISGRVTDRRMLYSSYINTYIERDVKEFSGVVDALKFMNFITAAAALAGQMVNYKTIGEMSDIDQTTAKSWLRILEALGIIFYLHPYSNNFFKRSVKTHKLYFFDTGLVSYLTRWSDPITLMHGAMSGALLENYVVSEIVKSYYNAGRDPLLYYYRDKDSKEIDLLMEENGTLYPIEIKKTATPDHRVTKVFNVIDKFPLQRGPGVILCTANTFNAIDKHNFIVPIWMI